MTLLKLRLVFSAFVPGGVIAAVRLWEVGGSRVWSVCLLALSSLAVTSLVMLLRARESTNAQPYKVAEVEDQSNEVPGFLLTYVFPFVFLTVSDWRDVAAYVVLAGLLLVLIMRTDLWKVNPLLLIVGYRTYLITHSNGRKSVLFSKSSPVPGQVVKAVTLAGRALKRVDE